LPNLGRRSIPKHPGRLRPIAGAAVRATIGG
jgi:hypothetical protein